MEQNKANVGISATILLKTEKHTPAQFRKNFHYRQIFVGVMFVSALISFTSVFQEAFTPLELARILFHSFV